MIYLENVPNWDDSGRREFDSEDHMPVFVRAMLETTINALWAEFLKADDGPMIGQAERFWNYFQRNT